MSSKTRNRTTRTSSATSPVRTQRPVPTQTATVRTGTEHKLWAALHANPNSTTADLASTAKIGRSTAGKILAKWHKDGSVTRAHGRVNKGGRLAADLWDINPTDTDVDTDPTDHIAPRNVSTRDANAADSAPPPKAAPDTTDPDGDDELTDNNNGGNNPTEATNAEVTDTGATETEFVVTKATTPAADGADTNGDPADGGGVGKRERLAPGALRGKVEDFLRDHPDEEFGPTSIAKALGGKSSGAVSNCLDKLEADGTAAKTNDKPRRFALAASERAAPSSP